MKVLKQLFDNNQKWALNRVETDPEFFNRLVHQQSPEYLWIGCSDSRVPANEIVGLFPGELFVHRNVANLVVENDLNCLSAIQFAIDILKVKHIIVCGHYGCGGVKAVLENTKLGLTDNWLKSLKLIKDKYLVEFTEEKDKIIQFNKFCEVNVIEQVFNVCNAESVRAAWKRNQNLSIHGWIYDIKDGLLQDLNVSISNPNELEITKKLAVGKISKQK
jgi:carbonic anhydrase